MNRQASVEIVTGHDRQLVRGLIALQQSAYPPQMQCQEPDRYYEEALSDLRNINVVLRSPQGALLGYLLALPQTEACKELRRWDPQMQEDPSSLYLEIVQTYPESRRYDGFKGLLAGVCAEAGRRGYRQLCLHVRTSYGLHHRIRKLFPDSRSLRLIDNWWGSGEPFEYIETPPSFRQERSPSGMKVK